MEHSEIKNLLSPYLDGELGETEVRALEDHLSQCAECAARLDALKALDGSVQMTRLKTPPEGYFEFFPAKLRARIRSEGRAFRSIQRVEARLARVRVGATVFVVLMAFGIGVIYGQRGLPVKRPRFSPIPLASRQPALGHVVRDRADVSEEEELESTDLVGSRISKEPAGAAEEIEVREKRGEPRVVPGDVTEAVKVAASPDAYDESRSAREEDAEGVTGGWAAPSGLEIAGEKKGEAADPEEVYTVANLAQLQRDYDKAIDGYARVVETSPGTELAAGAQFQINVLKAAVDTRDAAETLRESAEMWEEYIGSYPRSDLVPTACDFYTQALYSIAQKTQAKPDVENAIRAIEDCSSRLKDKSPTGFQDKLKELKKYLDS